MPAPESSTRLLRWGIPIVAFWLVMTALLIRRELPGSHEPIARSAFEPTESWLGIYAGDPAEEQRIGLAHLDQQLEERGGAEGRLLAVELDLATELFGRRTQLRMAGSAWQALLDDRAELDFTVRAGDSDFRLDATVAEGRLVGTIVSAGEELPLELAVPANLNLSSGLAGSLALPDLDVGESARLATFDPITLSVGPAQARCVAREVIPVGDERVTTRVFEIETSGLTTRAWVDRRGEVVQAITPLGLSLRRLDPNEAADLAPEALSESGAHDLLELTAVRPGGVRPHRGVREMRVRLSGAPGYDELPVDATQTLIARTDTSATYRIATPEPGEPAAPGSAGSDELLDAALAADAFVQSDHPRIRAAAAAIVEGVSSPRQRAEAIHRWVYTELVKEPALTIPSALDVLEHRRGDCNEHAVLYTALARAAGLPTRIAIGLVWSEELDGFYYHAWPEVHLDGRWRWLDPTLGQETADATHIKLLNGGIERWPQLLPFLGQLEIEVETVTD